MNIRVSSTFFERSFAWQIVGAVASCKIWKKKFFALIESNYHLTFRIIFANIDNDNCYDNDNDNFNYYSDKNIDNVDNDNNGDNNVIITDIVNNDD